MQRHFFATAEDLLAIFDRVEAKRRLAYTRTGLFSTPDLVTVRSGAAIVTLHDQAPHPGAVNGYTYLVALDRETVAVQEVPQRAGGMRYAVDQAANPRSVIIRPGGLFDPGVHLSGYVGTISKDDFSVQLYRAFAAAIARSFRRVRSYYLGPQAEAAWRRGMRLTADANSPPEYDLAEEKPRESD